MASSLITSYQLKSSAQGTTPLVTPSFTPTNGEVITVTWETFDPTITMTITNSGSQTIAQKQLEQPGGFNGTCGINAGTISGSPGSMTITGTPSASARYSMTVERWAGSQLAGSPVTNGNTATTGPIQSTLTPTGGAGGVIVWVGQDSQSVDPSTRTYAGSGTDDGVRDDHIGSNGVGYHGYQTITGNTSQTYGLTAPTGVVKWVIAGLEVQPAAAAASPPPPFAARRRLQVPRRRTVAGSAIKTQVVTAPTFPPQPVRQPRRLRGLAPRRGRTFSVVPPQVIVQAPAYIPPSTRFTIRRLRLFRARNAGVPQPQTIPSVPSGRARLKLPKFFRGSTTQTPAVPVVVTAPTYLPPVLRARTRLLRLSRGRTAAVIPPQVVAPAPPAYVAPSVRSRARLLRWFRPAGTQTPIAQAVAPTPPAYVPPSVRVRVRLIRLTRGRTAALIPQQTYPPAPPAGRVRIRGLFSRRARSAQVIPPQVTAVAPAYVPSVGRGRARALAGRRTRGAQVVPPQIVPATPPPYVAPFARALRRGLKLFRPHAFQVPANGQAAPVIPVVPPVTPVVPANGWNGLQGIMRNVRNERTRILRQPIRACPHDGEPLRTNRWGMLFCEYDGWQPEGQVDVRTGTGDWGGLRAIKEGAQREKDIYTSRPVLACPHDGEPLSISRDGIRFCKFDGWQPPNQNVTG